MRRALLITSPQSYRLTAYLEAAADLGVELVVASNGKHSLTREVAQGIFIDPDDASAAVADIAAAARDKPFSAAVATDDATVELAARIAGDLGLSFNSIESARLSRRKDLARQRLRSEEVPVPDYWCLDLDRALPPQLENLPYPLVLKPVSLSASRGVIRVDSAEEAFSAIDTIRRITASLIDEKERLTILAESYIPGREVAFEGLLIGGELQRLALFDKPDPLTGPYFEETYYITPSRLPAEIQTRITSIVSRACAAYGLNQGPVHAELRLNEEGMWILEVAARTIGGECSRMLDTVLARPLETYILAASLGTPVPVKHKPGASGVLMIPVPAAGVLRRVEGEAEAARTAGVTGLRITVEPGHVLERLPEASGYLGFIFAAADTPAQVETSLRQAHAKLRFRIDPLFLPETGMDNSPGKGKRQS